MRDDIGKLPLSKAAKAYARRKGLKSMQRQPRDFQKVNAQITNPGKKDKFQNYDVGQTTSGKKVGASNLLNQQESAVYVVNTLLYG